MKLASKLAVAASGLVLAFGLATPAFAAEKTTDLGSGKITYNGTTTVGSSRIAGQPFQAKAGKTYTVKFDLGRPVETGNNERQLNFTVVNALSDINGKGGVTKVGTWALQPDKYEDHRNTQGTAPYSQTYELTFTVGEDQQIIPVAYLAPTKGEATGLGQWDTVWTAAFSVTEEVDEEEPATPGETPEEPAAPAEKPATPAKPATPQTLPQTGDAKSHVALGVVGLITTALAGAYVFKKF